jgi:hypothetical protein
MDRIEFLQRVGCLVYGILDRKEEFPDDAVEAAEELLPALEDAVDMELGRKIDQVFPEELLG